MDDMTSTQRVLHDLADMRRRRLEELRAQRIAITQEITCLDQYLRVLRPLLRLEGIAPTEDQSPDGGLVAGGARPGNRMRSRVPPRREPYQSRSLMTAIQDHVWAHGEASLRQLTEVIYDITSHNDYERASAVVSGVLTRGCRDGIWERTGHGLYRLADHGQAVDFVALGEQVIEEKRTLLERLEND